MLSHRIPVFGLVGHYPTNHLIGRKPVPKRRPDESENLSSDGLDRQSLRGIRPDFSGLSPASGLVTYVLLSRLPLSRQPKSPVPFDLHALDAPPAFVLSQDQDRKSVV